MATKIDRCSRCRRRLRCRDGGNEDFVAGLLVGLVCPGCQTAEEHLGAEVNLVLAPPSRHFEVTINDGADLKGYISVLIRALAKTYPDHTKMRAAADRLAAARSDRQAKNIVGLMRRIADSMESGELWADDEGAA